MLADLVGLPFKVALCYFCFLIISSMAEWTSDEIVLSRLFGVGFAVVGMKLVPLFSSVVNPSASARLVKL